MFRLANLMFREVSPGEGRCCPVACGSSFLAWLCCILFLNAALVSTPEVLGKTSAAGLPL